MHELSLMSNILDIVVEHAQRHGAQKVTRINLRIGVLSDIIPQWAQTYFDMLSRDTIADGASLEIERVPVAVRCGSCGHEETFRDGEWQFTCVKCGSMDIELMQGRELSVASIEVT